jgi:hypothetical protein
LGRHKKPCNQICPKCNSPCRFRVKSTRGGKAARYIERTWARHEDGTECYIDNFVKAKDTPSNIISKFAHTLFLLGEQMKKFPLTEVETRRLNEALRCHMLNFTHPQRSVLRRERFIRHFDLKEKPLPNDTNQGWSELVEGFKELEKNPQKLDELRLKWSTIQDISNSKEIEKSDPLFRHMRLLYNKYESPKRIARRKMINQKLSDNYKDGKVGKTVFYTGIEEPNHVLDMP